jgi:uncharacterized membrane protein
MNSVHPNRPSLRALFITGLLTLTPIWLVWIVFKYVFIPLSGISQPLVAPSLAALAARQPQLLGWLLDSWVQFAIALVATLAFVLLVGAMARWVIGQRLLRGFEALIDRVPLARTVYGSARQLLDLLQTKPDGTQRVVLIDFPHRDMKSVGFVTRVLKDEHTGADLAAVYVPTTPNPTSGYLEIVPVAQLTPTSWTIDEAMSFIISGGAVSPEKVPFSPAVPK